MNTVVIGKTSYEVLYTSKPGRVVIRYDGGLVVLADQNRDGTWDLSGQPASLEEQAVITRYMPANDTTEVDIVKDSAVFQRGMGAMNPALHPANKNKAEEPIILTPFMKNSVLHKFCDVMYRYTFEAMGNIVDSFSAKRAEAFYRRLEKTIEPAPAPPSTTETVSKT